tara:strand:+ start:201 stop:536 length:336 start_codon:yes stop_codon:yes gene_type:complete
MDDIKRLLAADAENARYDVRRMTRKFRTYVADVVSVKYPHRRTALRGYMVGDQILFEGGAVLDDARERLGTLKRYKKDLKRPGDWAITRKDVEILVGDRGDVAEITSSCRV